MAKNKDNAAAAPDNETGEIESDSPGAADGAADGSAATSSATEADTDIGNTPVSATIRALILRDCGFGDVGTVVALERVTAETGRDQGALDLSPAAVQAFGG